MKRGLVLDQRYLIERLVGQGASGDVYRAEDRLTGAPAAVKVLRAPREEIAERFDREASVLAGLEHPGVVRLLSFGRLEEGQPYLAMEWLEGEDLARRLARGRLDLEDALALGEAVAAALAAAHARGVVHRDVKPANLFLVGGDPRRARLLDFGLARLPGAQGLTVTGAFLGTPAYMAPEQVRGARDVDGRADLYALGGVLFECLTGRPPFAGGAHLLGLMTRILTEPAPRLADLAPDAPPALDALIASLLEKSPEARPQGAEAVARALAAIAAGEGGAPIAAASAGPGSARAERKASASALTAMEQRLLSVILVAPPEAPSRAARAAVTSSATQISPLDATLPAGGPDPAALQAIAAAAAPFEARVEGLLDGAAVVLLSGRASATDQAADAARCALAVRRALHASRASEDRWIALCTGRGHLGSRPSCSETSALAALLLEAALRRGPPRARPIEGAVLIDEVTAGLLDARFQVAEEGGLRWLSGEDALGEPARLVLGRPTPFLGRERELGFLRDLFEEVRQEETASAALVLGEAGMGKSRLGWELAAAVRASCPAASIWIGRADPMGAGTAFGLIAAALRSAAGIREGEPAPVRYAKLSAVVGRHLDGAHAGAAAAFLGELVGAPACADDDAQLQAARRDPVMMGDRIRLAFTELVAAAASPAAPLLLLLEDLHWGDLPSLQLLDLTLRSARDRPLLVVGLSRPDLGALHPRLWAERGVHEIRLGGLPRRAAERLVKQALGDAADVAGIVERAAGHPLFLEELIRAAAAPRSRLTARPPAPSGASSSSTRALGSADSAPPAERAAAAPETVLAMVQARVARLDPEARRVLRAASNFGEAFWRGGASRLLGGPAGCPDLDAWLALLVERELIHPARASRFPGEAEYAFRHALMREAAYAMLTEADRRAGHELAAEFLERAGEDRAAVLAEHHERGGSPGRALPLYLRAARQALEGSDLASVLAHADRAIQCGAVGEALGEALALQAEAHQWMGGYEEATRLAARAMEHLPRAGDRWCEAAEALAISAGRRLDQDRLIALSRDLSELAAAGAMSDALLTAAVRAGLQAFIGGLYPEAEALFGAVEAAFRDGTPRDMRTRALLPMMQSHLAVLGRQLDGCIEKLLEAAELYERAGDLRAACSQRLDAALFQSECGQYERARAQLESVLAVSERLGLTRLTSVARTILGAVLGRLGRIDEGLALLDGGIRELTALGDIRMGGSARNHRARFLLALGRVDAAAESAEEAVAMVAAMPRFQARVFATLARARLGQGRLEEALAAGAAAMSILERMKRLGTDEISIRLAMALVLRGSGDLDGARRVLSVAREQLLWQAGCIKDPEVRAAFLDAIADHRLLLKLAEELGAG